LTGEVKPVDLRMLLLRSGYLMRDVKAYAYARANTSGVQRSLWGIAADDAPVVKWVLENDACLVKTMQVSYKKGYPVSTSKQIDRALSKVLGSKEIRDYTGKFVHHKMRFILNAVGGLQREDLENDMFGQATFALLKAMPVIDSELHAVNIAKQVIHNRGQNIIKEHAAESRSRLTRNADGTFASRAIPLHLLPTSLGDDDTGLTQCNSLMVGLDGSSAEGASPVDTQAMFELRLSIKNLYRSLKDPSMRALLKLWAGVYDPDFSVALGYPNDEWMDQVPRITYLTECAKYLGVPGGVAKAFLEQLKHDLQDFQ
jgi:hypothetical protein